jgi:murein DD-endopeptidase MepM/ murein hydrolase activator NlpD
LKRRRRRPYAVPAGLRRPFHALILLVVVGSALYAAAAGGAASTGAGAAMTAATTLNTSADGLHRSEALEAQASGSAAPPRTIERRASVSEAPVPPGDTQGVAQAPADTPTPEPTPTATATPAPSRRESCEDSPGTDLYCVYTVQSGDTLSSIAREFEIEASGELEPAEMLAQSNRPDVVHSDEILPGQKLRIPALSGIIHTVVIADSLSHVAGLYGVEAAAIKAVPANDIEDPELLAAGSEILVPGPRKLPEAPANPSPDDEDSAAAAAEPEEEPTETPAPTETPEPTATPRPSTPTVTPRARNTATATATGTPSATPRPSNTRFAWPAQGPISSYFGPSHPLGIDIDGYQDPNQPIKAAAAGTVTFAGGNPCCSYGLYVIVEHDGGFTTLYAHLSSLGVTAGQKVSQGQTLGRMGRTGYATGNHLHFEVHIDGDVVDPLRYLPPR